MINEHQDRIEQGCIIEWREDRGLGFIETDNGEVLFFHISEFNLAHHPKVGEQVVFVVGENRQTRHGRLQVKQIHEVGFVHQLKSPSDQRVQLRNKQLSSHSAFGLGQITSLVISMGFYVLLVALAVTNELSWLVVGWYAVLGIMTYMICTKDKAAAHDGAQRIPELILHALSAVGGWAGALVAQSYLHHKLQKPQFRMVYYLTVAINLAGLLVIWINKESLPF